ncbi:phospho-sugar mutase [Rhodopirellula sp. SWK7]|uniref:phospho-sugar mutase n=1 Tax=Rhodopirellula sp. SWK7 TaxID=595460 RepID=UPI0002BE8205|nr:phospho-sugar mutase [Rhodopirellula sp. SWK7]EMI45981.1 phosphoglucomutase/phosphomannomutase family protein [Rhodopirellula sp. SWK7]
MSTMPEPAAPDSPRVQTALAHVEQAVQEERITAGAAENIRCWLTENRYREYRDSVLRHIDEEQWQKLDDVFWTIIPFGTGGRRGRMYEIGSNAINDRTIGESAQGLADYVVKYHGGKKPLSCAIAYDTRHRSRHFTELCAEVMVAAGIKVYLLDDYRATPQLSFAVRYLECDCGIMVTASHNPPSDNAVKVYWSSGAQVLPPHDKAIIDGVMSCQEIKRGNFEQALKDGQIEIVTDKIDAAFLDAASACSFPGPREVRILYSPLHGVGEAAVVPLLQRDGFESVTVYEPHRQPSGDFPNVPGHVSNPENSAVFEKPIEQARIEGFDLVMATDPDCDRLGIAAPKTTDTAGEWGTFTGNQIAALLANYVLDKSATAGKINDRSYVVKTLVTTELVRRIATAHGARCVGDLLVGYKYIAEAMDREGPEDFLYGCEESHGYLVGSYARDKDGAVACMLASELAAELKAKGQSMHDYLGELYQRYGYHSENLINVFMEGSEGMAAMKSLMKAFREAPPKSLGGMAIKQVRDYQNQTVTTISESPETAPLEGPVGNLIIMDMEEEGNYVAVRPSGTEPKVKFYIFTRLDAAESQDLEAASTKLADRIRAIENDVRDFARVSVT